MQISAHQHAHFLRPKNGGEPPFLGRSMEIVKDILLIEDTSEYFPRGKTRWAASSTPQIGWSVGHAQRGSEALLFQHARRAIGRADLP